uniref:Alpha-ketoglutarate-dependent dioxygenase AlkB-like domain-containing protein n=1 Tax=Arcella intermedia TaxID=1963864 RepID=A0A6B2LLS5_9EUKA
MYPSFITPGEHDYLVDFVSPLLDAAEYYSSHWDQVISEYREMELHIDKWDKECRNIFSRQRSLFPEGTNWKEKIHVLDLQEGGRIDHHIDSVDASGSIISGISLLSDSVFQLKDETTGSEVDVYLPKRSLYIMKNSVRYNYGHAIQPGQVDFNGKKIKKTRRISIISRDKLTNFE